MSVSKTVALIHFDEVSKYIGQTGLGVATEPLPVDVTGTLLPLQDEKINVPAPTLSAFCGLGRFVAYNNLNGFYSTDANTALATTLSTRDVTVEAIVDLYDGAQTWPCTIVCRGKTGSSAERVSYCLEVDKLTGLAPGTHLELRWRWDTAAGVTKVQPGATFVHNPAAGWDPYGLGQPNSGFLHVVATRRWVSSTEVWVRYYINGQLLAEHVSADGDIGGATTGTFLVGVQEDGAGNAIRAWHGTFDELKVTNYEMSREEVCATWLRLSKYQPQGTPLVASLMPAGLGWGDQSKRIGKLVRGAGQGLGFAWAKAEELHENWLPDRAYDGDLDRWEALYGAPRYGGDSLDQRRSRVVGVSSRDNGYSVDQIKALLVESFALPVASIQILEHSNLTTDDFAATLAKERWWAEPSALWSTGAGALNAAPAAALDMRWDGANFNWYRCTTAISNNAKDLVVASKFTTLTSLADVLAGLHLFDFKSNDALWFGATKIGGVDKLAYASLVGGVFTSPVALANLPIGTLWLRIRKDRTVLGKYTFEWSTTSETSGFTVSAPVTGLVSDPCCAGYGFCGLDSSSSGICTVAADDFRLFEPQGTRALNWYGYRDPALAGTPHMDLANLVAKKVTPAHEHGAAITSKSLKCDSVADGGCDRGPMGAL